MEMASFLASLLTTIQPYLVEIALALILIGLANCIWGYRWLYFAMGSQGLIAGLLVGSAISYLTKVNQPSQVWALVIFSGITGAAMSLAYKRLSFFLMGGLAGILLVLVGMVLTGGITNLLYIAGGALVCGGLLAVMEDAASMVSTPLVGAWGLAAGLAVLSGLQGRDLAGINLSYENILGKSTLFNLAWLVFALAGLVIQQGVLRKNLSNQRRSLVRPTNLEPENANIVAVKLEGGITDKYGNAVNPGDINWLSVDQGSDRPPEGKKD